MNLNLNLLLLGLTGSGKSATVKSIVMKEDIESAQGGWDSVRATSQHSCVSFHGRVISVVDTPGLFNTHMTSDIDQMEHFRNSIHETFQKFPGGFHALVLVTSYGRRYGKDDEKTMAILKEVFGKDWLKTHGVALITCGDKFKLDLKNESFEDRCKQIPGPMGAILKECQYRCVLFDNVTNDKKLIDKQRDELVNVADALGKRQACFTLENIDMGFQMIEANQVLDTQVRTQSGMNLNLNLLLLGLTGSGKTATVKSIVMKKDIESAQGGWDSDNATSQHSCVSFHGRVISVVDTPGLFNTHMTSDIDQMEHFRNSIHETFQKFPGGFHALVLVTSYGRRYGKDDEKTMAILKEVFGKDWLKTHGVALITCGDKFKLDLKNESFEDRCKQIPGPMGAILKECQYRCVLFDNVTNDKKLIDKQRDELVNVADALGKRQACFTLENIDMGFQMIEATQVLDTQVRTQSGKNLNLNLLLLGLTGSGKTATVKSIVMKKDIESAQGGWDSVNATSQHSCVSFHGRVISVVDTPGLFNTHMTSEIDQMEHFRNSIHETFQMFPGGFHALVLVTSYGRRYGQDDEKTMAILKEVFGKDWLKTHGVALITCGDKFKLDLKDESFEDRCKQIPGPMGAILKECQYRCVLFDNVTNDKKLIDKQRDELVNVADALRKRQACFTLKNIDMGFQMIEAARVLDTQVRTQSGKNLNLNLLLLGLTGSGKTATVKSIVMKKDIESAQGGWDSDNATSQHSCVSFHGRIISVVDTPGLFNTHMTSEIDQMEHFRNSIHETFQKFPGGFHALVLVTSYGRRYGKDDVKTMAILKEVFGKDWLKTHGVALITCGDKFKLDLKNESFEDRCKQIPGPMGAILKECQYRCVLFDNVTNDKKLIDKQRDELVNVADALGKRQACFTLENIDMGFQMIEATQVLDTQVRTQSGMNLNLNLLLLGLTGSGKTATVKSIVMKKDIESAQGGWDSVRATSQHSSVSFHGRVISVVETPGLFNTHMTSDIDQMVHFRNSIHETFQKFPGGFHALVLVTLCGCRYGQDDEKTMAILKEVFGKDWLKTHGVVLFTCGDKFKLDLKSESFEDRCKQIPGPMGAILKECQYRCVLFDNVTNDKKLIDKQRDELVNVADALRKRQACFTLENIDMGFQMIEPTQTLWVRVVTYFYKLISRII